MHILGTDPKLKDANRRDWSGVGTSFRVVGLELKDARPDGALGRNHAFVHIDTLGMAFRVPIRRSNGKPHLPMPLMGHPEAKALLKAVADYWSEYQAQGTAGENNYGG